MRAALCKSLDGPSALELADIPEPQPRPDEVIVRVKAVGLNFADTLITRGKYQYKPDLPFSPGAEIAGVVETSGAGLSPGTRVMAYVNYGGAREKVAVRASDLVTIPDGVSDTIAAGLSVTYGTALHGLHDRAQLESGETVVVTGAAGGAGQAAVEVAKLMGARVIAVASMPEKLQIAKHSGADETILFPGSDLKQSVRALTGDNGADVIYDCIGGEAAEPLVRALTWQGRYLVVGFASGEIPRIPINLLLVKGTAMLGVFWGESVRRAPRAHAANMARLLDWVAVGKLAPRIHGTFPLERITEALAVLDRREATGKVVLTI